MATSNYPIHECVEYPPGGEPVTTACACRYPTSHPWPPHGGEAGRRLLRPVEPDCDCAPSAHTMSDTPDERKSDVRERSKAWEDEAGYDSIQTIEWVYEVTAAGAYVCCWPNCRFSRHDAEDLWRHVHTAHGAPTLPPGEVDHHRAAEPPA